jgi:xylulose-5-phosphate/fructose-6-phosphate phosphoketolase
MVTSPEMVTDSISCYGVARSTVQGAPLSDEEVNKIDAYLRAAHYLMVGMLSLRDNPLLKEPLKPEHIKNRLLGHWGSGAVQGFIWVHLNRAIKKHDLNAIYLSGHGHGAPSVIAPSYFEGTYSEVYPETGEDEEGMKKFFKQFSFPGGTGSHCTPEIPGWSYDSQIASP